MMTTIRGVELFADKGYDSRETEYYVCIQTQTTFSKKNDMQQTNTRKRGVVSVSFPGDKQRRLIVRYEKYVTVYMQMTCLFCGTILERRLRRCFWTIYQKSSIPENNAFRVLMCDM